MNNENRAKCRVFLLSGFLGSGKTTLLKNLLTVVPEGLKAAVLMNEFGKAGVDGDIVQKDGLRIIEISRGSIFCACAKGDFLRALRTIFKEHSPNLLLVEASGVADTTDMKRDLTHTMLSGFYQLAGNVCVVDALRFESWLDMFNAVIKQVEAATHIVINKTDLISHEELGELDAHVKSLNKDARVMHTQYGKVKWSSFEEFTKDTFEECEASLFPSSEEWEEFIAKTLSDITGNMKPPDNLSSLSVFWEGSPESFKELLGELPEDIIRSKGYFVDSNGEWRIFNIVGCEPPEYSSPDLNFEKERNLAIFIRAKRDRKEIPSLFQSKGLKLLEVRF